VLKKSAVHAVHAVMTVVRVLHAEHVALRVAMLHQPMVVTSLLKQVVMPLSAFAKPPRQLQ
jgi:hypothetical protein